MVGAGKAEGSMDVGNLLKPMLARGELHCIGAGTTLDLNTVRPSKRTRALERRFQTVLVDQPSVEDTYFDLRGGLRRCMPKATMACASSDSGTGRRRGAEPALHLRPFPA